MKASKTKNRFEDDFQQLKTSLQKTGINISIWFPISFQAS